MTQTYVSDPADAQRWQENWVPVDRRLLGLDKRTLLPAAVVLLLFAVAVWILPAINNRVTVEDPIVAGDVIQVGSVVEFVPAVGANLLLGLRKGQPGPGGDYPSTAAVSYQGTVFEIITDAYNGTPAQLLEQIKKNDEGLRVPDGGGLHVTSEPVTITNAAGEHGVAAHYDGTQSVGLVAAFVFGGTGVEIEIVGPQQVQDNVTQQIAAMLRSVRPVAPGSGS
ncbi:hypothetical protein AB0C07_39445 [Actinoplanes missouriensis]|uniref:hypothetical protein n=1 Tax=Actinoplanes missouriensis TaxID=1866 RepID=UPI0033DF3F53